MEIFSLKFEKNEIIEMIISTLILAFIFSLERFSVNVVVFLYMLFLVLISFFPHFLIQKYFAKKLGYSAKYKIYFPSLLTSIFVSLTGFKLAAPGYSEILPYKFSDWKHSRIKISNEEIGKLCLISLLYNIFLSMIGIVFGFEILKNINAWIAFSNLLPVLPLEGAKILRWDFEVWFFIFILAIILLIL